MAPRPLSTDEFHEITMGRHQWLDMDPLTFSKIVQVQLEDIEHLPYRGKGKQRAGTVTDAQFALQVYVDGLTHSDETISDGMMSEDVAPALSRGPLLIGESSRAKQQLQRDLEFTSNMAVGTLAQINRRSIMQELQSQDTDPLRELWPALVDSDSDSSLVAAESSTWAAARVIRGARSRRRCIACSEEKLIRDLATIPCRHEHEYCRSCLSRLIQLAIDDESFFPPKCDGDVFPVDAFADFLPQSLLDEYHSKAVEYETKDGTCSHESTCAAFISKSAGRLGDSMSDDTLRQSKETMDAEIWQTCYMCHQIVQLEQGCNHIMYVPILGRFPGSNINDTVADVGAVHSSAIAAERNGRHVLASIERKTNCWTRVSHTSSSRLRCHQDHLWSPSKRIEYVASLSFAPIRKQ